ncbi:MAG: ATP-binding protein [Gemmatimonadota bacterium]
MESASGPAPESQSLEQLTLLYALVDHLQRARRAEHVYQEAVDGLCTVLSVDGSVLLTDEGGSGMEVRASSGLSRPTLRALQGYAPWPRHDRSPEPWELTDLDGERAEQPVYAALRGEGLRTVLWVPLLHRGRLIGEVLLGRRAPRSFGEAERRLAEVIAGHVAFSIWRARSDEDQAELLRRFEAERSVLESVVNQMPAGVLLADVPSGRIVTSNPQITAIWGRSLRQTARISDYALWGGLTEDDAPLAPESWPLARSVLHGETVRGEEVRIECGDGRRGIVRMSSAPVVDSSGRQLAAVATVFDVTREREEEERQAYLEEVARSVSASIELEATLDAVARAVAGPYADWSVVYRADGDAVTRAAAAHRDPGREESVRPFARGELHGAEDHPVRRALRERGPVLLQRRHDDVAVAVTGDDDELRGSAATLGCGGALVLPLHSHDREVGAVVAVRAEGRFGESDVELLTELARRAALAIENALLYERARAADRAKSTFLAVMSHEFRTPLSAILGYADILTAQVHGKLNPKQTHHLERVKASVRHLSHLVDEILTFASMEAGRERVSRSRTDIRALVSDAVGIMEPIAEATGLALEVSLPESPLVAQTDGSKVRQIVINLVSNALKYTPEGVVRVELGGGDDHFVCTVADTGPGIAPEHLERVFEPFWQVDQSSSRVTGTGLGLAVARRLARLMGGDLTLESELGRGSLFTLTLPLEPPAVATGDGA